MAPKDKDRKKWGKRLLDLGAVVLSFLLPLFLGAVFLRLLVMEGAPLWCRILMGVLFLASLVQAGGFLYLLLTGRKDGKS